MMVAPVARTEKRVAVVASVQLGEALAPPGADNRGPEGKGESSQEGVFWETMVALGKMARSLLFSGGGLAGCSDGTLSPEEPEAPQEKFMVDLDQARFEFAHVDPNYDPYSSKEILCPEETSGDVSECGIKIDLGTIYQLTDPETNSYWIGEQAEYDHVYRIRLVAYTTESKPGLIYQGPLEGGETTLEDPPSIPVRIWTRYHGNPDTDTKSPCSSGVTDPTAEQINTPPDPNETIDVGGESVNVNWDGYWVGNELTCGHYWVGLGNYVEGEARELTPITDENDADNNCYNDIRGKLEMTQDSPDHPIGDVNDGVLEIFFAMDGRDASVPGHYAADIHLGVEVCTKEHPCGDDDRATDDVIVGDSGYRPNPCAD